MTKKSKQPLIEGAGMPNSQGISNNSEKKGATIPNMQPVKRPKPTATPQQPNSQGTVKK